MKIGWINRAKRSKKCYNCLLSSLMKQVGVYVPDYLFLPNPIFKSKIVAIRITDQKEIKNRMPLIKLYYYRHR
jgi:hypothetical protein